MPFKDPDTRRLHAKLNKRRYDLAARQAQWRERCDRVASRPLASDVDRAWAAGHFEGEGTIFLSTHGTRNRSTRVIVCLTSTDRQTIEWFQATWPGCFRSTQPRSKNDNAKRAYIWTLNASEPVECFLRDILPFVRTDRVRAKVDLALADIIDRMPYRWDGEAHARSLVRRAEMKMLNQRGRLAAELRLAYQEGRMAKQLLLGPA